MFRGILLLLALAFVTAKPNVGMFEEQITAAIQKFLGQFDPKTFPSVDSLKINVDDTSLEFSFENLVISGFSTIECTSFTPNLAAKHFDLTFMLTKCNNHADSYTGEGTLDGAAFSGSGAADLVVNALEITLCFDADSFSLAEKSLCISEGTLDVDLVLGSLEANLENGDALNDVLNTRGPELFELLQGVVNKKADKIVGYLNKKLCKD